ncbi:hypothetical protein ACFV0T_31470 [Streptomyces sp. NPDC059582]|uniref:hypothetical protein n=1 Tax=Streptomyces sp. NPDC059582 TaxID=3346875 RepID=UPI003697BA16
MERELEWLAEALLEMPRHERQTFVHGYADLDSLRSHLRVLREQSPEIYEDLLARVRAQAAPRRGFGIRDAFATPGRSTPAAPATRGAPVARGAKGAKGRGAVGGGTPPGSVASAAPAATPDAGRDQTVHHTAGDHVDFGQATFHQGVVGVQYNYGTVLATAEWRPVGEVDPVEFGVRPTRHVPGLPDVPPYVPRDCDGELRGLLAHAGLVLILGEPYAGRSYTAWNGVRSLAGHRLYAPAPGEELRRLLGAIKGRPGRYVVWLDELADHLQPGGLDRRLLGLLTSLGVVVLGTMSADEYYRRRSAPGANVVAMARKVELPREWSAAELRRLAEDTDDPRAYPAFMWSGREGAAPYFAIGHLLFDEWQRSGTQVEHPHGQLLVQVAVDLTRCGVREAVPTALLRAVEDAYPTEARKRESFEDALAWATAPLFGVSGLLVAGERPGTWRAYGALVAEALGSGDLPTVPDNMWRILLDESRRWASSRREAVLDAARAALRPRVEAGDFPIMVMFAAHTEGEEHEDWLRRAADLGHTPSAVRLAELLLESGDEEGAVPYLEAAAGHGDVLALRHLGLIHRNHAAYWLSRAVQAGDGPAAQVLDGPLGDSRAVRRGGPATVRE